MGNHSQLSVSDDEVQPSRHLPDLVSDLNASLPSDICVLSAARCAKSTVARHSLAGREYTYFVPLAALVRDSDVLAQLQHVASLQDSVLGHSAVTAALRSLAACTQLYTGSHPWHNFTRHKQRSMLAKCVLHDPLYCCTHCPHCGGLVRRLRPEHVGLESPPPPSHRSEAGGFDDFSHRADAQFAQPKAWSIATQAFRTVTKCEVGGIELFQIEDGTNIPVVPVFVHGQGFIYNQIRHMMGACIAVCRGLLDESAIHAALTLPRVPPLPLAPPGGLLLTGARWLSKLRTVQNLPAWQETAAEPQLSQEAALKALERGGDLARLPKLALLHTEHQRAADKFFNARIKPSIARWAQSLQDRAEFERLLAEQAAAGGYVGIAEEGGDGGGGGGGGEGGGPSASDDAHDDGESNDIANPIVDGPRYDLQLAVPEHHSFGHSLGGWLALLDQQLQSGTALEQQALLATRLQAWAAQQQPLQRARNLKAVWRRHCAVASSHPHLQRLWNAELFARGMKQLMLPTNSATPASAAQLRESIALSGGVGRPPLRPPSVADSSSTDSHTTAGVNGAQDSWRKELSDLEGFLWFAQMPLSEQQELQLQAQTDAHMLFPMATKNMSLQRSPADVCEAAACTARASAIGQAEPLLGLDPAPLGTDAGVFLRSENIPFEILQEAIEEVEGGADSTAQASSPPQSRQAPPEWEDIAPSARIKAARLGEQQLLSPLVRLAQLQKVLPKVRAVRAWPAS